MASLAVRTHSATVDEIVERLSGDAGRVVLLTGLPGIGKSTTVSLAAGRLARGGVVVRRVEADEMSRSRPSGLIDPRRGRKRWWRRRQWRPGRQRPRWPRGLHRPRRRHPKLDRRQRRRWRGRRPGRAPGSGSAGTSAGAGGGAGLSSAPGVPGATVTCQMNINGYTDHTDGQLVVVPSS